MRSIPVVLAASAIMLMSPPAARAQDVIKNITQAQFADILKNAGYRAEIVPANPRPFVRTGIGGHTVVVVFFDCKDACGSFQFFANFKQAAKFTPALVARWNVERRYAKTYLNKDGDLRLEYDVDLTGGVSAGYIKQVTLSFEKLLANLDEFVKAAPTPSATAASEPGGKAREAELLAAEGKYAEALRALDEAAGALWEKSPLSFRRALWVASPPDGFGAYNPRESNIFASGASMIIYAEPVGFGWRKSGEVWQTDINIELTVKSKTGEVLLHKNDFQKLRMGSRVQNREFIATLTYTFTGIPNGEYVVDTIFHDTVTKKSGTFSLPFVVR
jgi:hypothetical protein